MKILLVKMSSMGDLIHTLPAVEDLSHEYPQIELHWLSEESFADIARLHPFVQKVHTLSWRKWRKNLSDKNVRQKIIDLKNSLQSERYDFILDVQGLLKSALFAKMTGSPIMGLDFHSAREKWASFFYKQKFSVEKSLSAIERNRTLLGKVFIYTWDEKKVDFGINLPVDNHHFINGSEKYHIALTATSRDNKLWAEENWRQLFKKMHQKDGLKIYLPFGSELERLRAERLAQSFDFVRICPKMSLKEAAVVLAGAQSTIGVDTGLLHLANAVSCPSLGIFTVTDPQKVGVIPTAQLNSIKVDNLGGMGKIPTVDEVFSSWQKISSI